MSSSRLKKRWVLTAASSVLLGAAMAGCPSSNETTPPADNTVSEATTSNASLAGGISVDGSSTVGPITHDVAEQFATQAPGVKVSVGISGTGGGFKKFGAGQVDISNASRPIKDKEAAAAKAKGIDFIEIPVAYDGLSVVVNSKNTWAKSLTVAELKAIWIIGSKITNWSQVRKGFPNKLLKLYGPDKASGTFDYFNEEILGKEAKPRPDYQPNSDDNALVIGVSMDEGALGYFGFGYYEENKNKLNLVAIDAGKGPQLPSNDSILNGTYKPLSRPLFIYVTKKAADRAEVKAFVDYYLTSGKEIVSGVGYVPLPDGVYDAAKKRWDSGTTGTLFADKASHSKSLEQIYGVKTS
jgi:phosphate transport system substrate-binding protein